MPMSTPPSTWPSAPTMLMIVPESCAVLTCSTRATPVSRSSFTRTAWHENCGATKAAMPTSPTQLDPASGGAAGGGPEPWPMSSSPPDAMAASSAIGTCLDGEPATDAWPSASTMSASAASR